jgi:hypothetical protein
MQKNTLEKNILPKAKQRFLVSGLPEGQIIHLSRDPISMEFGVINLADQTRVPGGRVRAGEFTVQLQFGRDQDRNAYSEWWEQARDREGDKGINPAYKRDATIIYYRLFRGNAGVFDSGSDLPPVRAKLEGCWCSKLDLPSLDIKADSGDEGDTILIATIQFDNVNLIR